MGDGVVDEPLARPVDVMERLPAEEAQSRAEPTAAHLFGAEHGVVTRPPGLDAGLPPGGGDRRMLPAVFAEALARVVQQFGERLFAWKDALRGEIEQPLDDQSLLVAGSGHRDRAFVCGVHIISSASRGVLAQDSGLRTQDSELGTRD